MLFASGLAVTIVGSFMAGLAEGLRRRQDIERAKRFTSIALALLVAGLVLIGFRESWPD